jgi:phosphoribosylanthranilate isomerase
MTKIKICGITDAGTAVAAAEAGADYLGVVFAQSARQINPMIAAGIVHQVKSSVESPQMVGVFVNSPANDINFIADFCRLDWVQLSGDESWEFCRQIKKPVFKTVHIFPTATAAGIVEEIRKGYTYLSPDNLKILLDTKVKGAYGGTGLPFDWKIAREVNQHYPVLVAGGLGPDNIVQMISEVKPWGVDASSGVESQGKKDIDKIKLFISKVKAVR